MRGGYQYPQAGGDNAQPEVRSAVQRWRARIRLGVKQRVPLLYWLLGAGTPPYKMSKADSGYVDTSAKMLQVCANCDFAYRHVVTGHHICSQIAGEIRPEGWCRLWVPPRLDAFTPKML